MVEVDLLDKTGELVEQVSVANANINNIGILIVGDRYYVYDDRYVGDRLVYIEQTAACLSD